MEPAPGRKDDGGKDRWDLLPWRELRDVVRILMIGAQKYADHNWQLVVRGPGGKGRYFAAAHRHLAEWWFGEKTDTESGLSHLAHAICCLLFLLWAEKEQPPAATVPPGVDRGA